MRHLLFPTDFSNVSAHALSYAVLLAEAFQARLTLVHVLHSFFEPDHFTRTAPVYSREEAEEHLRGLQATVSRSVPCDYRMEEGIAADAIGRLAEETGCDLIVVGTAGSYDSPEVVAASHTADLISRAACAVLAVPLQAAVQLPTKVVLALDFAPLRALSVLSPLVEMARHLKAEVLLLNVVEARAGLEEKQRAEVSRIEDLFSDQPFSLHVVSNDHTDEGITQFATDAHAQLIAVVRRKHGLLRTFFHDSVTKKVALYTHIPLMTLPE